MNTQDHAIGSRCWAIADGYIPAWSSGPEPEMVSHEALCFLNMGTREAHVRVTILFSDRDPAGPYLIEVPSRRTKHVRINNLKDPEPIPHGIDFAAMIESDEPIVVQQTRLDSRQRENGLMSTIAYSTAG